MTHRLIATLLLGLVSSRFAAAQTSHAAPATTTAQVPVTKVVLFSSGVGYFEHAGTVRGNSATELRFKTSQINDILKSLVLQDEDRGRVGAITYLSQDPLAKALKSFASFQQGTNFRAWMFRILRNTFLTARTRRAEFVSVEEEGEDAVLPPDPHTPESILLNAGLHQRIQAALARLPVQFREVILLCDVEDMRYQEIAEMLGVPVGTVMSRISRGRRLLRGMLAEDELRVAR